MSNQTPARSAAGDSYPPEAAVKVNHHVEMQVVAWMVSTGQTDVELVVNREPCGERFGLGCHQVLPMFLLAGHRLSISGTRGGSRYYSHSYVFVAVREVVATRRRPTVVDMVEVDDDTFEIVGPRLEQLASGRWPVPLT